MVKKRKSAKHEAERSWLKNYSFQSGRMGREVKTFPQTMATVKDEKYSPQSLECPICKNIFNDPKILSCLHSFCRKCLESYDVIGAGTNSIVCPLCRKLTAIPVGGAQILPSNFLLTNALDHLSVKSSKEYTLHCTNCEDEAAATSRCLDCAEFLCSNCVLAHRRIRVTKDHRILSLDTLQADKQTLHRPSFCTQHADEMFMFYCVPCDCLICRECTILDHRGHKYAGKALKARIVKLFRSVYSAYRSGA